ncbi:NOPCHAP1/New4 family protein [Aspergillus undulatus]|uniref:NOPCHAP1/New4 family protein n=1 Tax=Aspergillus undulatus TaxID=1810928 RepID=UPI003CCCD830
MDNNNAPDDSHSPSNPISLPDRSRAGTPNPNPTQHIVTNNARRETSASAAVNGRDPNPNRSAAEVDEDEDDYTSSSGSSLSSSSEDEDEDDDACSERAPDTLNKNKDEGIPSLPALRKPNIRRLNPEPSLLSKLSAFLPQMKSANEDLQREIEAGRGRELRLDNEVDEDEDGGEGKGGRYIEMNLGLGVLEEKRPGEEGSRASETQGQSPIGDTNLMDQLMGKEKTGSSEKQKPSIQDLGE